MQCIQFGPRARLKLFFHYIVDGVKFGVVFRVEFKWKYLFVEEDDDADISDDDYHDGDFDDGDDEGGDGGGGDRGGDEVGDDGDGGGGNGCTCLLAWGDTTTARKAQCGAVWTVCGIVVWHSMAQWGSANANGTVCGTPVAAFLIESQRSALVWQGGRFQFRTGGAGGG